VALARKSGLAALAAYSSRSIAGCVRFFTLTQCFGPPVPASGRPERQSGPVVLRTRQGPLPVGGVLSGGPNIRRATSTYSQSVNCERLASLKIPSKLIGPLSGTLNL
jgi:hypothetical protein